MPREKQSLQFSQLDHRFSATVSMPVKWTELENILPSDFTILTVPNIFKRHGDPWKDIHEKGQDLAKILDNLSSIKL